MPAIRDEKHKRDLIVRLKRIEGQLRGIQAMIEKGEDCQGVAQQISASRSALDKAFYNVLACAIQSRPESGPRDAESRIRHAARLLASYG
ncbi:MAG TPA: metal-sensing transcriptional repressor [Usitatibacter sp.]|nr:metal-sensing transcriptional repressor [Usitatibacter sp.]